MAGSRPELFLRSKAEMALPAERRQLALPAAQYWWWPAALAVVLYLVLSAIALLGAHLLDLEHGTTALPAPVQAMSWPGVWARWDSGYYINIAENGYSVGNLSTAFYPLYPALMRGVTWLSGLSSVMTGTLLSLFFAALAFVVLYRIVAYDYGSDTAWFSVLLIAVFPTAFYFYSIYTEALFLLLSVSAYALARTRRWLGHADLPDRRLWSL
jgi:hypothetical protein